MPKVKKLISIAGACYDELDTIEMLANKIKALFAMIPQFQYESSIVDDGSTDSSLLISCLAISSACFAGLVCCPFIYLAFTKQASKGFFTLIPTMLFCSTLQLIAVGVLAEYIIYIFRQVKGRPSFIIEDIMIHENIREKKQL